MAQNSFPQSAVNAFGLFDKEKFAQTAHKKFMRMVEQERIAMIRDATAAGVGNSVRAIVAPLTVAVRKRPLNSRERELNQYDVVSCPDGRSVVVHEPRVKYDLSQAVVNHGFTFDAVYGDAACTVDMYRDLLRPRILNLDRGGQVTAFAYGQTGSGKSFTMAGLVDAALEDVFRLIASSSNQSRRLVVCFSYFEIYCAKVYDLLRGRALLTLREDETGSVQVVGLSEHGTRDIRIARELLARGSSTRSAGTTKVNADSSRSHSVLQLCVREGVDGTGVESGSDAPVLGRLVGKASLVDLAGSEQACESAPPDKATHHEAAEINKSLLALKECIRAMARGQAQAWNGSRGARVSGPSSADVSYGDPDEASVCSYEEGAWDGAGSPRTAASSGGGLSARRPASASVGTMNVNGGGGGVGALSRVHSFKRAGSSSSIPTAHRQGPARHRHGRNAPHVHIPFRGSKLTQILRDCFTCPGAVTIMIATIGPCNIAADHSLNTLRYADRLKGIGSTHSSGQGGQSIAAATSSSGITTGPLAENRSGIRVGLLCDRDDGAGEEGREGREVLPGGFTHTDPRRHVPPPGIGRAGDASGLGLLPVVPTWPVGAPPPASAWALNEDTLQAMRREAAVQVQAPVPPARVREGMGGVDVGRMLVLPVRCEHVVEAHAQGRGRAQQPSPPPPAPPPLQRVSQTAPRPRPTTSGGVGAQDSVNVRQVSQAAGRRGGEGPEQSQLLALLDAQIAQLEELRARMATTASLPAPAQNQGQGELPALQRAHDTSHVQPFDDSHNESRHSRGSLSARSRSSLQLEAAVHAASAAADSIHASVEQSLSQLSITPSQSLNTSSVSVGAVGTEGVVAPLAAGRPSAHRQGPTGAGMAHALSHAPQQQQARPALAQGRPAPTLSSAAASSPSSWVHDVPRAQAQPGKASKTGRAGGAGASVAVASAVSMAMAGSPYAQPLIGGSAPGQRRPKSALPPAHPSPASSSVLVGTYTGAHAQALSVPPPLPSGRVSQAVREQGRSSWDAALLLGPLAQAPLSPGGPGGRSSPGIGLGAGAATALLDARLPRKSASHVVPVTVSASALAQAYRDIGTTQVVRGHVLAVPLPVRR